MAGGFAAADVNGGAVGAECDSGIENLAAAQRQCGPLRRAGASPDGEEIAGDRAGGIARDIKSGAVVAERRAVATEGSGKGGGTPIKRGAGAIVLYRRNLAV